MWWQKWIPCAVIKHLEAVTKRKRELIFYRHSQLGGLRVTKREPTIEAEAAP
jgi:hypothetical protein